MPVPIETLKQYIGSVSWILLASILLFLILAYLYRLVGERSTISHGGEHLGWSLMERILKLKNLKLFEISISWLKGFSVKVEFFERKNENE